MGISFLLLWMSDDYAPLLTRTIRALSSKQFSRGHDAMRRATSHPDAALGGFWPQKKETKKMQEPDKSLTDPSTDIQSADPPLKRPSAGRTAGVQESAAPPGSGDRPPSLKSAELAGDILYGAEAIVEFLFGDRRYRRKVYNLIETQRLPHFRLGATVCARRSILTAWIVDQERCHPLSPAV